MQLSFTLHHIQTLTRRAAVDGYISLSGNHTDDSLQKMSLKELCQNTIDQVFAMIGEANRENAEGNRQLIHDLRVNFQALSKRYENHTTFIGRHLTSQGAETMGKINRLLLALNASDQILQRLDGSSPEVKLGDLDQILDELVGAEWDGTALLLVSSANNDREMVPLQQKIVDWTTNRSREWLGISLFSFSNPSMESAWKIIPYLDFKQYSVGELKKIHLKFCKLEGDEKKQNWQALADTLCKIGFALIEKGEVSEGRSFAFEGYLMKVSNNEAHIRSAVSWLNLGHFQHQSISYYFSSLLLTFRAGLLNIETVPKVLGIDRWLLESLQSEDFQPSNQGSFSLNAAVCILRHCKRLQEINVEEICALYGALVALSRFQDPFLERPDRLFYNQLHQLYRIYDWFCRAEKVSINELKLICPGLIDFCANVVNGVEMMQSSSIIRAFAICRTRSDFTEVEKRWFLEAVYIETCFPRKSVESGVKGLKKYSPKVLDVLRESFPFAYALEVQATKYGDQDLSDYWGTSIFHNPFASIAHHLQAPLDVRLVFQCDINSMEIESPSLDVAALMLAAGRRLQGKFVNLEWHKWFSQYAVNQENGFVNISGRRTVDKGYFASRRLSEVCTKLDLTDTCVNPDTVFSICNHDRPMEVIYADHVTPGNNLLALNKGEYALEYSGGVRHVHESLLKEVAQQVPRLDVNDVDLFLEYCYTHQISKLTFASASQLIVNAFEQNWVGIGEYCLAYLIGSTNFDNLLERWEHVQGHDAFASYRYFCMRLSLTEMTLPRFYTRPPLERNQVKDIGIKIFNSQVDIPEPPAFVPVDLRHLLPDQQTILCDDQTEVSVNLVLMGLHADYFKHLQNESMRLSGFSGLCIKTVVDFVHSGKLPEEMNHYFEVLELCSAARHLEMPALQIALIALIKHRTYVEEGYHSDSLRKLAYLTLGQNPEMFEKDFINLFQALPRYDLKQLESVFAARLGMSDALMQSLKQFARDQIPPKGLSYHQQKIFYEWVNRLNLTSWHLIV